MASKNDATLPMAARSRRSLGAQFASKARDKENATVDIGVTLAVSRKKLRSKSMGPDGLDALKPGTGNRRSSLATPFRPPPRSILKTAALPEIPSQEMTNDTYLHELDQDSKVNGLKLPSLDVANEEDSNVTVVPRTEEEHRATSKEKEERERRDARRKSLANRRVSFAAEATLHTFHEIEYLQDSTTSTDSSRRLSSRFTQPPPKQGEPIASAQISAMYQSHEHSFTHIQGAESANGVDNNTTGSIHTSLESDGVESIEDTVAEIDSASGNDSDGGEDGTMVSVEEADMTGVSVVSAKYTSSEESSTLAEALRLASERAHAQLRALGGGISGALDEGEEIIPAFVGWTKKRSVKVSPADQPFTGHAYAVCKRDQNETTNINNAMDITQPVGHILRFPLAVQPADYGDVSMDVTRGVGDILYRIGSNAGAPLEVSDTPSDGDAMDFTMALGKIRHPNAFFSDDECQNDEDLKMDFTTAVGGLLMTRPKNQPLADPDPALCEDDTMDITADLGTIIHAEFQTAGKDSTIGMEMDLNLSRIINVDSTEPRSPAGQTVEVKIHKPARTPRATPNKPSKKSPRTRRASTLSQSFADANGSPAAEASIAATVREPARVNTPIANSNDSRLDHPGSPSRKDCDEEAAIANHSPLQGNSKTHILVPSLPFTPQKRLLSDGQSLASSRLAVTFGRRESIGETAAEIVPDQAAAARRVVFEDLCDWQIGADLLDQVAADSKRKLPLSGPRNDKDVTLNLMEMINSLSPKKNQPRGRKSLHAGSASGILGKRPVELDEDDEEEWDMAKRLKGHRSSPIKNIKLQQPPTKAETTGRVTRSSRLSLTSQTLTPSDDNYRPVQQYSNESRLVGSPNLSADFKAVMPDRDDINGSESVTQISLQDFLDMTSIKFMELDTTKRRLTSVPLGPSNGLTEDDDTSLESRVVAGACIVPMLEMYQHTCRELKSYISEGRRIVREIEAEISIENPPVFREYMSATPEVKILMDNQFKNIKAHARLLSKAMWYEWRMKLQTGLKEGLDNIMDGLRRDEKILEHDESVIESLLPKLLARLESLQSDHAQLEAYATELADCDPNEFATALEELAFLENDVQQKTSQIDAAQRELSQIETSANLLEERKRVCSNDIKAAEKTLEECKGWTTTEVSTLRARVDEMENTHGWAITGISGTVMSMTYKRDIQLEVDMKPIKQSQLNSAIDLRYIGADRERNPQPLTIEKDFFLCAIRDHLRALPQDFPVIGSLVRFVSREWDRVSRVSAALSRINLTFPTTMTRSSNSCVGVHVKLLLVPLESRVDLLLELSVSGDPDGIRIAVTPSSSVEYGEQFNVAKVSEFLDVRLGGVESVESWSDVILELHGRLLERGRRGI